MKSLLTGIVILFLISMLGIFYFVSQYWTPKTVPLSINRQHYSGHYYGLDWSKEPGFFGRDWFRIDERMDGFNRVVDVKGLGYNSFHAYYPDGTLKEEGECWVAVNGGAEDIFPDFQNIKNAKYFSQQGKLLSEVVDGTGKQIDCYPSGQKSAELVLEDGNATSLRMWAVNGQLTFEENYKNGIHDGVFRRFFSNGKPKEIGWYKKGKPVGAWIRYNEDGTIKEKTDYSKAQKNEIAR